MIIPIGYCYFNDITRKKYLQGLHHHKYNDFCLNACGRLFNSSVRPHHAKRGYPKVPSFCVVGTVRLELMTSCMSSMRSNQLSYAPVQA